MADKDFDVGYGKPPKHTQFKKGQSGNPDGRPKGRKSIGAVVEDELFRKITVQDKDGRLHKLTMMQAIVRSQSIKASKGDTKAFNSLMQWLPGPQIDDEEEDGPINITLNMGEPAIQERVARAAAGKPIEGNEEPETRSARLALQRHWSDQTGQ